MSADVKTPELEKMAAARAELSTQAIGAFLEWCQSEGIVLARWHTTEYESPLGVKQTYDELVLQGGSIDNILMRYAGVDPVKVENERRAIMAALWGKNRPKYRVEFDRAYRGGDYTGTGDFVEVWADSMDAVPAAFTAGTNVEAVHIVRITEIEESP